MTISQDTIEELVGILRNYVPKEMVTSGFTANPEFFKDFDSFKVPLIGHLSDNIEEAIRTVPDDISEDTLRGYLDGTIFLLRLIANLNLIQH